ncbi:MAG: Ig-like domain-containing protein [Burkholderiales bacterium]|nr:Ig-like domain-containing protein [Burkholderiales bacterium]
MKLQGTKYLNTAFAVAAIAVALGGCSAGGGDNGKGGNTGGTGGTGGTTTSGTIVESLSSSTVTAGAPATVTATVKTSAGVPIAGAVVTFSTGAIGLLSSATALTNSSGVATVTLSPSSVTGTGADTVTATVTIGSATVSSSQGYQLSATSAQFTSFAANTGTSATDKLAPYAQAILTLNMSGVSTAAPAALSLTSQCVAAGKATISPATVSNTTGTATFTYKDNGCGATLAADTVTASITSGSSTSTQVYLTSPTANSITFSSATPATIYLKGSGYAESSTVKFQVVDTDGNPLPGQQVTLALSTQAGGLLLNQGTVPVTETSDASGFVSAIVNSGTVPTPVRVTATLPSGVSTVSSLLSVATGLPTQLHFSLSQATFNIEGGNHDGIPNTYTVRATDRSGNPVPDGTSILFWAEGGQIQATATTSTTNGISSATANFVSQDFRPADGRVTVLAYAIGEESFIDLYGSNVYQAVDASHPTADPFQDLGDIVKSRNFDNIYDPANDEIISLSLSGSAAGTQACVNDTTNYPQFATDESVPVKPNTCNGVWSGRTYVRRATETVFSTSSARPLWLSSGGLDASCTAAPLYVGPKTVDTTGPHAFYSIGANPHWYANSGGAGTSGTMTIIAADANGVRLNPMPAGTSVSIASDDSTLVTLTLTGGSPIPNSVDVTGVSFGYKFGATATSGSGTINFTSPLGLKTTVPFTISAGARPSTCP